MKDSEPVQRLIRLKRYETPGEEYFGSFLEKLQERQRSERLRRSRREIVVELISDWYEENFARRWLVPVGAAAAATIGAGLYFALPVGEPIAAVETAAVSSMANEGDTKARTIAIATAPDKAKSDSSGGAFPLRPTRPDDGQPSSFERTAKATGGHIVPVSAFGEFREL